MARRDAKRWVIAPCPRRKEKARASLLCRVGAGAIARRAIEGEGAKAMRRVFIVGNRQQKLGALHRPLQAVWVEIRILRLGGLVILGGCQNHPTLAKTVELQPCISHLAVRKE